MKNGRYRKQMVQSNFATLNDQRDTPSEEELDVEASFMIVELKKELSENQVDLENCFNEYEEKLNKGKEGLESFSFDLDKKIKKDKVELANSFHKLIGVLKELASNIFVIKEDEDQNLVNGCTLHST